MEPFKSILVSIVFRTVLWPGLLPTASGAEQITGVVSLVMHIKHAFRIASRIASRLTLCQVYQLERAPKEFGSAFGYSFKEHTLNYLRRHLHSGDERFLCRSVSCGVCARVGCLSLGNWAHFGRCFSEHAYAGRRTLCSRSVEATARADYLLRVDRAASMDLNCLFAVRSCKSLGAFSTDSPGL